MSRKIAFYSSSDEFSAANKRYEEIMGYLAKWPNLKQAIETNDNNLFERVIQDLPYTDYCMVTQLFELSQDARHDMKASYREVSHKYRVYVRELHFKMMMSDLIFAQESPHLLFCTAIVGGVCALSIALGKDGQLIPFISDSSLITIVLSFSGGILGASVFAVLRRKNFSAQKVQELKNLLAKDPSLYETYGACMVDSNINPRTIAKIFALMKEKN